MIAPGASYHKPSGRSLPTWVSPVTLAVMELLALLVRVVGIGKYHGLIYDEYYYVPAADTLIGHKSPVLVKHAVVGIDPNLLSHPPLAKELIALAILMGGNHPWVWRLPGLVLESLVPFVVYVLAKRAFKSQGVALLGALLAAFDGLSISMARVALPDGVAVPLALINVAVIYGLTMREGPRLRTGETLGLGVLLGLGLSAEWVGGQTILLAWIWLAFHVRRIRQDGWRWFLAVAVIPLVTYFGTYFYAFASGFHQSWLPRNLFLAFGKLQWLMLKDMWKLRFFHPWSANAWSWIGIPRPTALLLSVTPSTGIRLMAFSNPVIIWCGILSLAIGMVVSWRHRHPTRQAWLFLTLWFLVFYATWLMSPRSKFDYYFATASLGLDLALAAGLWMLFRSRTRWMRTTSIVLGCVVALSSLYLLPLWTGMAVSRPFYHAIWWPTAWNGRIKTRPKVTHYHVMYHPPKVHARGWAGLSVPASGLPEAPTDWTMFQLAGGHETVFSSAAHLSQGGYALHLGSAIVDQPAVVGSSLFLGTKGHQVFDIRWQTGRVGWSTVVPNQVMTTPLVHGNTVVVGLGNSQFRRRDPKEGWIRGQGVNGLMALSRKTGHEAWFYPTQGEDMATPVMSHGLVYEATGGGRVVALDDSTGRLDWSVKLRGFDSMSSPILVGHVLYVAVNQYFDAYPASSSTVYAIDVETHHILWSQKLSVVSGLSDCSLASDGQRVYVAGVPAISKRGAKSRLSNRVYALNAKTGHLAWSRGLGSGVSTLDVEEEGVPLVTGGVLYIGSPVSHHVSAFVAASGHRLWTTKLASGVTATPMVVGSQVVVETHGGGLVALSKNTGTVLSADPVSMHAYGPEAPIVVGHTLIAAGLKGTLLVQPVGH